MFKPFKILNIINDISSCAYYRNLMPVINCREELAREGIALENSLHVTNDEEIQNYDAYIFSRIPNPLILPMLLSLANKGKIIIFDNDDELWNIPTENPASAAFTQNLIGFAPIYYHMSKYITVSTETLADSLSARFEIPREKITVLENLISTKEYKKIDQINRRDDYPITKILYTGSASHVIDMEPVRALVDYYKDNEEVIFVFYGYLPDDLKSINPSKIIHIPTSNRKYYEQILQLISPDIALMPLADIQFNHCKSSIKYFEMSMSGAASIASNVKPYSDAIVDGESGYLVSSDEQWINACDVLIYNTYLREHMIENAQRNVVSNFSWDTDNPRRRAWLDFFRKVAGTTSSNLKIVK